MRDVRWRRTRLNDATKVPALAWIGILGTDMPVYRLLVIGIAFLAYAGIWLFLNRTIMDGLGSIKGTLASAFILGQVVSLGSLVHAPHAQMAPFAIMLLILLVKPAGPYGSALLKR